MNVDLKGKRIAIYARFSSDNQRDTSIDDQVRFCTEFITKNAGEIQTNFVLSDHAMSGSVRERPAFERLQRLVQRGEIQVVVCECMDRLSRDLGDADRLWKLIDFYNVRLICVADGIDSINESSKLNFRMKAVFADEYLSDLARRRCVGFWGPTSVGTPPAGSRMGTERAQCRVMTKVRKAGRS